MDDLNNKYKKKYGFSVPESHVLRLKKGLNSKIVKQVSSLKNEPDWMKKYRLLSLACFEEKKIPNWGPEITDIDFNDFYYYLKPSEKSERHWGDVPEDIKETFEKLGVPKAEREYLSGVKAQFDSEVVYKSLTEKLEEDGVIFMSTDEALKKYPDMFKEYFGKIISYKDNKFSALNGAVWSGGSFIYIPKGVKVKKPLQTYFRINALKMGQFERTLIIADEGSSAEYMEGCTAPIYSDNSLHVGVVEVFVKKNASFKYTTVQNWSKNVYNLVTKRAFVEEGGVMRWVDGNIGSKVTMKYPSCILAGTGAYGEMLSLAYSNENQHQDSGAKMIHVAPNTSSKVVAKSISSNGGRSSYRGLVLISSEAEGAKSNVKCDALILDEDSRSDTYPKTIVKNKSSHVEHEALVSKVEASRLFYLMSRGLKEEEALGLIVSGFVEPIVKSLPLEYAVELNRLIELEMERSIG